MEYKDFKELFLVELEKNNLNNDCNINNYYKYMKCILNWNDKINLTSIKDEREFIVKHFIDSLTVAKFVHNNDRIIDVGTGAGFPGIPLKLYYEKANVTLIDSVNKKIKVLKDIIQKLELKNIESIHIRAEEFAKNNREKYDIAISRAVANMSTLVEYLLPFVKIGGNAICMKGPNLQDEIDASKNAINILGGKIEKVENIIIDGEIERNIVIIKKIKNTPNRYPRGQSKPLKEPLK